MSGMMVLLVVCFVLVIALSGYIFLLIKQIGSLTEQLNAHISTDTKTDIRLDVVSWPFTRLRDAINGYIDKWRSSEIRHNQEEMARREFITNISHDIRTPVTSISGYFQLLLQTDDKEKQRQYADIISGRLKRFQDMLEEFFEFSKIESQDVKTNPERIDVKRTVSETLFMFYNEIEEKFGSPEIDFGSEEFFAFADGKEVERVFQNVLRNALLHGKDRLAARLRGDNDYVYVEFENVPLSSLPDPVDRVFERTFKGEESRSEITGTGLGLCIVKEVVEKYNGFVKAENDNGNFKLTIAFKRMR